MTNSVSPLGLFASAPGARDAKVNEDNVLASFAGVLAGVNQANAKLLVPTPQVEGATNGEALENTEDGSGTAESKKTEDATNVVVTPAAVAATAPLAINSSVATLNPALQEKLARVISRVREETGHDVQVTETNRSQARQNVLYAQGRQTAGPVVTWTQSSKHTTGRAVDVTLDGGRAGEDAYTALQRIANEEGLRTLGARDPGHLELPSSSAGASGADDAADASAPGMVSVARLAQIAQTARVEQVTSVGTGAGARAVRSAAFDGNSLASQTADAPATTTPSAARPTHRQFEISDLDRLGDAVNATRVEDGAGETQSSAAKDAGKTQAIPGDAGNVKMRMAPHAAVAGAHAPVGQPPRAGQSSAKAQNGVTGSAQFSGAPSGRSANSGGDSSGDRGQSSDRDTAGYTAMGLRGETTSQFSVADVSTEMASTASDRAERIMAAQDAPARPLSQIVMSVDAGNGTTDRIQVALRGSTVSATIDAADHHAANAMRAHGDELVRSLTRDGVDVDSVRVRSTATTTALPVATVDSSQKSSDSSSNSRFNREAQWDQQRSQQRSNSERRNQQRDQRGEKES